MQQHGSKFFARRPPSLTTLGDGDNRSKCTFFQNIVMLIIKLKGIMQYSNMVANILPADPLSPQDPRGLGQKV